MSGGRVLERYDEDWKGEGYLKVIHARDPE